MPTFTAEKLKQIGIAIFQAAGVPLDEAILTVEILVKSNLCGHDSHGVIRIPEYIEGILNGVCRPGSTIQIMHESPTTALVNGNWGLGQVVATETMNMAIQKASEYGAGAVSTFNCCHIGRMADYALMAVPNGMIGICIVNSRPGVAPYGGIERMLNQGPLGIAIPAGKEAPFVLDISTSVCAGGKIAHALDKGEQLPEGCIIDKYGNPSSSPRDYYDGGACLPFGGPVAYKGYGLSMMIDIMAGLLSGRGPAHDKERKGQGVFQMALKIESFQPWGDFSLEMDSLIRAMKNSKKAPGFNEILVPGQPEMRSEKEKLRTGINVPEKTWQRIMETASKIDADIEKLLNH